MSADKVHTLYHVESSPRPTETMTLAMVLDEGGSYDMLLFCLDGLNMTSWTFCVGLRLDCSSP